MSKRRSLTSRQARLADAATSKSDDKRDRRAKAKRWSAISGGDPLFEKKRTRLERLESTNHNDALDSMDVAAAITDAAGEKDFRLEDFDPSSSEPEDSSDEEVDMAMARKMMGDNRRKRKRGGAGAKKKKAAAKKKSAKRKRGDGGGGGGVSAEVAALKSESDAMLRSALPSRRTNSVVAQRIVFPKGKYTRRTLGAFLVEDFGSVAAARVQVGYRNYLNVVCDKPKLPPPLKLCEASMRRAKYTDPRSRLPFFDARARALLEENPPAWTKASVTTPHHEALDLCLECASKAEAEVAATGAAT